MNKPENRLSKWNFKKIAIAYIIVTILAGIGCAAAVGTIFWDRISFAWQYNQLDDAMEHGNASNLQTEIDKLAASSSDVIDILVLDASNDVTYSAKDSAFGSGNLTLTRSKGSKNYLVSEQAPDTVFRYVKGEEFMFASILNKDFGDFKHEYDDDNFYEHDFSNKTVYLLSFLGEEHGSDKVYIISSPTTVPGGILTIKIVACVVMLFFMLYWVLVALWVFQNASKAKLYPAFWGIIVLFTNLAGVIVYALYKRANTTCPSCGASQSGSHTFCSICGAKMGGTCESCGAAVSKRDLYCPRCGAKIK